MAYDPPTDGPGEDCPDHGPHADEECPKCEHHDPDQAEPEPWPDAPIVRAARALRAAPALPPGWSDDPWDDGPSQEELAESAARWSPCAGGWEQYTMHPFDSAKTIRLFQPRI